MCITKSKQIHFCCRNAVELSNIGGKFLLPKIFPNCEGWLHKVLAYFFNEISYALLFNTQYFLLFTFFFQIFVEHQQSKKVNIVN